MTIKFETILIRKPINTNKKTNDDNWQEFAHQWKVLINDQGFDYYTGSALVNKNGTPKKPTMDDVLHCLLGDYSAMEMSFYEWCIEFGYDTDSINAQKIYMTCQANSLKLKKTGIDINAECERLQDY